MTKGAFQKSELAGQTMAGAAFWHEIGFSQQFLLKNHLLRA